MSISGKAFSITLLFLTGVHAAAWGAGAPSIPLFPGSHIPSKIGQFADHGKIDDKRVLPVTIALSLNNENELDQRLEDMYRPGSPNFHQFMTSDEFRSRYSPTPLQIHDAQDFLAAHGIEMTEVSANGHFIKAVGSVSVLNEAFQTEVHEYQDASGKTYFAPAIEPTFPSNLTIRAVHGLDNMAEIRQHIRERNENQPYSLQGSGPKGGISPSDLRTAYQIPALTGQGQVMALVELDGYNVSDIQNYEAQFGLPQVPLQNIQLDGATGTPGRGAGEVTLDIEIMAAVAPGASILVYEGKNSVQSLLDVYSKIANDNAASVISTSWGQPEGHENSAFVTSEANVFKQMASQGQSFYAAAGDSGALDDKVNLSVDDPASQPYVTAVGGTKITLNGPGGAYVSETTWNEGSSLTGAGGGGISTLWQQPSWQAGLATQANGLSSTMRNVPDVSLNADPQTGYAIFFNNAWHVVGGTSAAAPIWAAFTALVNQERASLGKARLGLATPLLYAIGKSSNYANDFHDIADGSNNLNYTAVPGYDGATGWGTIQGPGLLQDLSAN